jgi:hypothetical protein
MTSPGKHISPSRRASIKGNDKPAKRIQKKVAKLTPISDRPPHGWAVMGFDVSMSSIAGAAIAYDRTLRTYKGPAFVSRRWSKGDHYFDRLEMAAKSHELVLDLITELSMVLAMDEVWIAQEEPFPPHSKFMSGGNSGFLKQQAEISGAFLGGLLRYGYRQIFQIHNTSWRKVVADQISDATGEDVTTHPPKWRSEKLAQIYNCRPTDSGKFRAQQWAIDVYEPWSFQDHEGKVPDWPPIIERKDGKVPRPEGSTAKAIQSDDRYEALAMAEWLRLEIWEDLERMMK